MKDFVDRVAKPALLPLGALLFIGVHVWALSRVLLAVEREAAVIVAIVVSAELLVGAAIIAARPRIRTSVLGALLFLVAALVIGSGAVATTVVGELPVGEEHTLPKGPEAEHPEKEPVETSTVTVGDNFFDPERLTIQAGTVVTWRHQGSAPHDIVADDKSFVSHEDCSFANAGNCLNAGDTYQRAFTDPGEFPYYCSLHGAPGVGMHGVIVVEPAAGGEARPSPTVTPGQVQEAAKVAVVDNAFEPREVRISPGDEVTWSHTGDAPHNITADDGSFKSHPDCSFGDPGKCMQREDTYDRVFTQAGRYPYYCTLHGGPGGAGMAGVVIVE